MLYTTGRRTASQALTFWSNNNKQYINKTIIVFKRDNQTAERDERPFQWQLAPKITHDWKKREPNGDHPPSTGSMDDPLEGRWLSRKIPIKKVRNIFAVPIGQQKKRNLHEHQNS